MNIKKITTSVVYIGTIASFISGVAVLSANAQTASTTVKNQANIAARLSKIISRSDTAITTRLTALNNLNTRIQSLKNVSATEKSNISNEIQTNISGLSSLKVKIDSDTDVPTAQADAKAVIDSYRIYILAIPQGWIESASNRVSTIVGMMTTISGKLQSRITADQTAGKDVSALQASLADLNAKIADASTQASTSQSEVASLVPDQGNSTVLASNTGAIKSARANIKTATSDLQGARQDAKSIIQGLKALNTSATNASSTVGH